MQNWVLKWKSFGKIRFKYFDLPDGSRKVYRKGWQYSQWSEINFNSSSDPFKRTILESTFWETYSLFCEIKVSFFLVLILQNDLDLGHPSPWFADAPNPQSVVRMCFGPFQYEQPCRAIKPKNWILKLI